MGGVVTLLSLAKEQRIACGSMFCTVYHVTVHYIHYANWGKMKNMFAKTDNGIFENVKLRPPPYNTFFF